MIGGWARGGGGRALPAATPHGERLSLPISRQELGESWPFRADLSCEHSALGLVTHCPALPRPGERRAKGEWGDAHRAMHMRQVSRSLSGKEGSAALLSTRLSWAIRAAAGLAQAEVPTSTPGNSLTSRH